eukprot:TRINITY_DN4318_c0_g1_i8.p3 TRINITY_DN4318_c0_g1~~TRINITY_DN4318_c0_g1_i8.p3  ORF type:complete len:130 (-),score=2.14 TRINITY_DN4318_c0_g1_i8:475-864(-)
MIGYCILVIDELFWLQNKKKKIPTFFYQIFIIILFFFFFFFFFFFLDQKTIQQNSTNTNLPKSESKDINYQQLFCYQSPLKANLSHNNRYNLYQANRVGKNYTSILPAQSVKNIKQTSQFYSFEGLQKI